MESFAALPSEDDNYLARARVTFLTFDGTVAAKAALDSMSVRFQCNLPANFAYAFDYAFCSIAGVIAEMSQYNALGAAFVFPNGTDQQQVFNMEAQGVTPNHLLANGLRIYEPRNMFRNVFYNLKGDVPLVEFRYQDDDLVNATAAVSFSAMATFMQYDITQILDAQINSGLPVKPI